MTTAPLIHMSGVHKTYRFFSLSDVGLRLDPGQIMGFVGPNGAGKSTTIRILMGLVRADGGTVEVLGHSMPRAQAVAKRDIGFVSDDMRLHGSLTLAWHMQFIASVFPGWDARYADQLLQRFNLHPDQAVAALSHGERVKAMLLLVLARRPRLLLLDEPTTGLDPVARHEILGELMDVMLDDDRGVLFSSHNTQDVEQICDRITFIDRGRIIASTDKDAFVDRWRRLHLELPPAGVLPALPGVVTTQVNGRTAIVTSNTYSEALDGEYVRAGVMVREVQRLTLEEIFVATVMTHRKAGTP